MPLTFECRFAELPLELAPFSETWALCIVAFCLSVRTLHISWIAFPFVRKWSKGPCKVQAAL